MFNEYAITHNSQYDELKKMYESIESYINSISNTKIKKSGLEFNVFQGDITKGIKWTWASNTKTLKYFSDFFESIHLDDKLLSFSKFKFTIRGASFITLNESKIENSDFHFDSVSHHDNNDTNIVTVIFPLYKIAKDVGHLEYKHFGKNKRYNYNPHKLIVWDSCKFLHRTEPYNVNTEVNRVLVSVNLSTDYNWAKYTINKSLEYQGNTLWIE